MWHDSQNVGFVKPMRIYLFMVNPYYTVHILLCSAHFASRQHIQIFLILGFVGVCSFPCQMTRSCHLKMSGKELIWFFPVFPKVMSGAKETQEQQRYISEQNNMLYNNLLCAKKLFDSQQSGFYLSVEDNIGFPLLHHITRCT